MFSNIDWLLTAVGYGRRGFITSTTGCIVECWAIELPNILQCNTLDPIREYSKNNLAQSYGTCNWANFGYKCILDN